MDTRLLGRDGPPISAIGFGAFKIGRNQKVKYDSSYELPSEAESTRLLQSLVDLGINYFDTAPAYGLSEARLGVALGPLGDQIVISTKVGEIFEAGQSRYDFSAAVIEASVNQSRRRLRRDCLDVVLLHSPGDDLALMRDSDAVPTLERLRKAGAVRRIGLSAKTVEGAHAALDWADVLMVEYHLQDRSQQPVIEAAHAAGLGVIVKKGLSAGHLPAGESIRFVLGNTGVSSLVIGSLSLAHMQANLEAAETVCR
jgi:aryl-alcohol dehydrogenase-like predicted oxidoreductase